MLHPPKAKKRKDVERGKREKKMNVQETVDLDAFKVVKHLQTFEATCVILVTYVVFDNLSLIFSMQ